MMRNEIKNIAFVGNTSFSMYKFRLGVMRKFLEEGYKVFVVAPEDEYSTFFSDEGIDFHSVNIVGQGTSILHYVEFIRTLTLIYKKLNIDFVFHYTIKPIIFLKVISP